MSRLAPYIRLLLMSVALMALLGNSPHRVAPPSTLGAYGVEFRGGLTGRGNAVVTPTAVNLNALLRDSAGNSANLVAPTVPLENGRFSGTGTLAGMPVQIAGRVDPPSDVVRVARLSCTLRSSSGETSRGVGGKR